LDNYLQLVLVSINYQQYPGDENKWIAQVDFEDKSHAQLCGV
jgi:hypothetical protein